MPNNMRTEADEKRDNLIKNIIKSIIAVIIVSIIISIILYITTDKLKSNKTLFLKYAKQNIENLDLAEEIINSYRYITGG